MVGTGAVAFFLHVRFSSLLRAHPSMVSAVMLVLVHRGVVIARYSSYATRRLLAVS